MRSPVPEALLYLVFKVQLRLRKTKVSFGPSTCQYQNFHTALKPLSCIDFSDRVYHFIVRSASNPYSTYIVAPKFNTSIFTPTHRRIFHPKTHINRSPLAQSPPNSTRNHPPNRPQTSPHDRPRPSPNSRKHRRHHRTPHSPRKSPQKTAPNRPQSPTPHPRRYSATHHCL